MQNQPTRRSFIIVTGITALASTRVFGANDTLRVGVIGAGGRMNDLLNAADKCGRAASNGRAQGKSGGAEPASQDTASAETASEEKE